MARIDERCGEQPGGAEPSACVTPEQFIGRHQADLWRYLRFLGCESSAAEDLCQEAFIAALAHRIEDRSEATAEAWLRTTARNLFRMQLRRDRRRMTVERLDELDLAFNVHAQPDRGETYHAALRQCLETLDARGREVLQLRFRDDSSRLEMASALGLSAEGVKTLLRRVKAHLRACIEKRRQA